MRCRILCEAGAAILFFGALAQRLDLEEASGVALSQLIAQGYAVPTEDAPVKVFPALTGAEFSAGHAGGWRPGAIYLRQHPEGEVRDLTYLRHELFHEASFRTCHGRLPVWAEEAAAMVYSGELAGSEAGPLPDEIRLAPLRRRISQGSKLQAEDRETLANLARRLGWPDEACRVSPDMAALLGVDGAEQVAHSSYVLMSVASGRVIERGGDMQSRFPPGSLLKIPYAAALSDASPVDLSAELAASDTAKLLQRWDHEDLQRLQLLLSPLRLPDLKSAPASVFLGERGPDGGFPVMANLVELGQVMRLSLLSRPGYFEGLRWNGVAPETTLSQQGASEKSLLQRLGGMAKTGTASNERGDPLVGHLFVAWPADHPVYLAIFRQQGVRGAAVLKFAAERLREWQTTRPTRFGRVRVRVLGQTLQESWKTVEDCPRIVRGNAWFTTCGSFRILSSAQGSRSERMLSGVLYDTPKGGKVLETDSETYADAVLDAEAKDLKGAARDAMRAVVVWNGAHGGHRHGDSIALCDTTHCMVFLGLPAGEPAVASVSTDKELLSALDDMARKSNLQWLSFASGGDEPWLRELQSQYLASLMGESQVLDVRRELRKDGEVFVRLIYPDNDDAMTCEVFRNALKLPACPTEIRFDAVRAVWTFRGIGAGHGQGLSIARAKLLSEAGYNAMEILKDAYER